MYGYKEPQEKSQIPYHFGLNAGVAKMIKFEWIPNGGKDGAEQEAVDIVFNINGREVSYRKFPYTGAYDKDNGNVFVTDPETEVFKKGNDTYNENINHILHAFVDKETLKAALSVPISSFKEFINILTNLLPKDFATIPLDIFLQYQWNLREGANASYLELPKDASQGRWVTKAQNPAPGVQWKEMRGDTGMKYVSVDAQGVPVIGENGKQIVHTITRTQWFMDSNWANQQKADSTDSSTPNAGVAQGNNTTSGPAW